MRIAVLASHSGTTLQALIDACASGELDASVCVVISNNGNSGALQRARRNRIPAIHVSSRDYPEPDDLDKAILRNLLSYEPDFVFLAGYMKKIGPETLFTFEGDIINTHPSLLPKYGGEAFYGSRIHEEVYRNMDRETGVTLHYVDEGYDTGEIIAQTVVSIDYEVDSSKTIEERVKAAEKRLVVDTFIKLSQGKIK